MSSFRPVFAVLALSSIGFSTILPIVGPKQYDVAITTFSLNDASRLDPFAKDNCTRSIMTSAYFPMADCHTKTLEPYVPPATALFHDEKFAAYGLPNGTFSSLQLETCANAIQAQSHDPHAFPLVLFSPGLSTSRFLYSNMLQSIAATGYTIVSIDHPYDADFVEFPDGTSVTAVDLSTDADIALALSTRIADIAFLHRQLTTPASPHRIPNFSTKSPVAIFGHSLGGATAAAATTTTRTPAFRGALNIDGTMFGSILTAGTTAPLMLLAHRNKTLATDPSWATAWPKVSAWKALYQVARAAHYSFSDLPLITAATGLQHQLPADAEQLLGGVAGERMQDVSVSYAAAFLDLVLKVLGDQALREAGTKFAEVHRVA